MVQPTRDVALEHQAATQRVVDSTAALAQAAWDRVDPNDIVNSYAEQLPGLTVTVSAGQHAAAAQADAYLGDVLDAQGLAAGSVAPVNPAGFAGVASDGGLLMSLMTNPALVTLTNIQSGVQVLDALTAGRHNLDMIVRTQVADAGRLADHSSLIAHPAVDGYTRIAVGASCSRCLILAGKFYRWSTGFARHPRCDCKHIPTRKAKALRLIQDPADLYARMGTRERLRAGFSFADQESIRLGADLNQVVNARRGVYLAGGRKLTREGTTRRGLFGGYEILDDGTLRRRVAGEFEHGGRFKRTVQPRLMPDQIFAEARDREEAVAMLRQNGYLLREAPAPAARERVLASMPVGGFAEPVAAVQVRHVLAMAQTPEQVSRVLEAEYAQITKRQLTADLTGSVETAREHAEGVLRAVEQHPDIRIDSVRTGRTTKKRSYAEADSAKREIVFSEQWSSVERRQHYLQALAGDESKRWTPRGTGNPTGVAVHETGHLLDPHLRAVDREVDQPLLRGMELTGASEEAVIRAAVSGYAVTSRRELIAEAWADVVTNGPDASRMSRDIVRIVEEGRGMEARGVAGRLASVPAPKPPTLATLRRKVADAGITVPTGASRGVVENLVHNLERGVAPARARETAVREMFELRGMVGDKLAEVSAALENGASARAMAYHAKRLRRLSSGEGGLGFPTRAVPELGKPLQDLIAALERGDAAAAKAALPKAVTGSKLKALGEPGAVVSRSKLGSDISWVGSGRGDVVEVLHPGYTSTLEGKTVTVVKPSVRAATPEQAQALRTPAKKAAAPRKAAAPDATGSTGLSTDAGIRAGQVENRIRQAAVELGSQPGALRGFAKVDDLRARIVGPEVSEDEFRVVVRSMMPKPDVIATGWFGRAGLLPPTPGLIAARARMLPSEIRIEGGYRPVPLVRSGKKFTGVKAAPKAPVIQSTAEGDAKLAARLAPAKKAATPRVPKAPAPEKMSLPALRTEMERVVETANARPGAAVDLAGLDLGRMPKPVMAELVTRARALAPEQLKAEVARWRTIVVQRRTTTADLLSEVDQLLDSGASARTLATRIEGTIRRTGMDGAAKAWPDAAEAQKILTAARTGDPAKVRRAVAAAEKKLGLTRVGEQAGSVVRYDRAATDPIGGAKIPADAHVVVVRPGYRMADGTVLSRPVVEEATAQEARAAGLGAKPEPIHELFVASDAKIEAAMRDVYEGQFGPYTTKVEVRTVRPGTRIGKNGREIPIDPFIEVRGKIFSAEGYEIGDFTRTIGPLEMRQLDGTTRREMWAHHDVVQIDPKYQGKGFGTAFNRRAIDWYRESGLHGIYLDDHNFYVWASQGFNFTGGVMPAYKVDELRDLIGRLRAGTAANQYGEPIPKTIREAKDLDGQIAAAEDLLRRYETLQPGQPGYPTAYEVSQLGRNGRHGKSATWLGKYLGIQAEEMVLNPGEGIIVS